ncbi:preprotein translocase subunit SecE [Loigolactobacillus coryniformis]|jgi:preprotein translocase subunit SecE|uniref:Protein translocase subunit SecE n=3 Tax=Loigolactobacillus coryniformis TaxID=1610 RepID=A0A0R1F5A9_9LACO|nr:preprotein translocase subunit SecE [Loigolactobacillus coryniformis]MDT3391560.1 preprotein translocase subunit SecE [Bacillota bacterium]OEH90469.1 preprotein translocase subunit SecE [Loigolactobacillus coryniformis subsp. coryniformis]RRG01678.1 MAG: preprotein translocase subunit SecE [Lactobacillus sp.]ATO43234.1 preprotein translocase subunit SecE [Loigolactobacillus coryniformis subsp. torquens DSM 20004 = KCTC 3535]ATO55003.1 preprotein translocase subunit SecE [Loigolactobacillus 
MKLFRYLGSVRQEMRDTTWPTRKELRHDTSTVVWLSILFAAYFAIIDNGIQWLLNLFIFK